MRKKTERQRLYFILTAYCYNHPWETPSSGDNAAFVFLLPDSQNRLILYLIDPCFRVPLMMLVILSVR